MRSLTVLAVSIALLLASCDESIEDRAATAYGKCAAEYGLEGGLVVIVRGPDGGFAITAPDLPEPVASECLRRLNEILE